TRLQLRNRGVSSIRTSQRRPNAESPLREVKSISCRASHPIIWHPTHQRLIHSALINQVLQKTPNGVIRKCRHYGGVQTEAALQSSRHVVLAASFIHLETSRRPDSLFPGIQPQHYFSKADQIPAAVLFRSHFKTHHSSPANHLQHTLILPKRNSLAAAVAPSPASL